MKYINHFSELAVQAYQYSITCFFWIILFFLGFLSILSTCYVSADSSEISFFVRDNIFLNIGILLVIIFLFTACKKSKRVQAFLEQLENDEIFFQKRLWILLYTLLMLSVIWVLSTQYLPGGDQRSVQNGVYSLHIKNYFMFDSNGYLSRYPNQLGLVWICYLFSIVFGSDNYIVFQLFNALGIFLLYREMAKICEYFGFRRIVRLATVATGILFFPLIMYCSFVYGNILGLSCSISAIRQELAFFKHGKKRSAIFSALMITLAISLKSNYLIFMTGMVIYAIIEMLRQKQLKFFILPVLILSGYFFQAAVPVAVSRQATKETIDQGASSWSWIAMGLQGGSRAPGWYNEYNWHTYTESGYNTQAQAQIAKEDIKESIRFFSGHPQEAVRFFIKKTASQWNNPTFQSFWTPQIRSSNIKTGNWIWHFTSTRGMHYSTQFLNLLQSVVLFGAIIYCIFFYRKADFLFSLIFAMIFIGGFTFHLFWEAKGQYTISYFVLLFPYACAGYDALSERLAHFYKHRPMTRAVPARLLPVSLAVLAASLPVLCIGKHADCLTADTEKYFLYLQQTNHTPVLEDGIYRLCTESGLILSLSDFKKDTTDFSLQPGEADSKDMDIQITHYQDASWLRFCSADLYLTATEQSESEGHGTVSASSPSLKEGQQWQIKSARNNNIYILHSTDYALTYDENRKCIYLAPFEERKNQLWSVIY